LPPAPTPDRRKERKRRPTGSAIVGLKKLWEREQGPPQAAVREGEWSSSPPSAPTRNKENKLCKVVRNKSSKETISGRKKQEDTEEESKSSSSSSSTSTLSGRSRIICATRPSERLAYLVGELKRKTDMPGCSGASQSSRASSSSTRYSTSTSSSSETATQLLPPAKLRSLSPPSSNSNGSTLRAHYQQRYAADYFGGKTTEFVRD
jgi:hypothetical protein